jgi:hypothetical protein
MASPLTQTLVEHLENAASANGARWDHHVYCYSDFQASVTTVVEYSDSFSALPGAFSSVDELYGWVGVHCLKVWPITSDSIITVSQPISSEKMKGTSFLWVKATSPYRQIMVWWLNYLRRDRGLASVLDAAATVYEDVAQSLERELIRKKITPERRGKQVSEFRALAADCLAASLSAGEATWEKAEVHEHRLLKTFDSTLDADHVINKQSLKMMPDAWVMLGPVIASSNRNFGRAVEKHAVPFTPRVGSIDLDAATAFKLFASTFPSTLSTLEDLVKLFSDSFAGKGPGLEAELQTVTSTLGGFVGNTSSKFVR